MIRVLAARLRRIDGHRITVTVLRQLVYGRHFGGYRDGHGGMVRFHALRQHVAGHSTR